MQGHVHEAFALTWAQQLFVRAAPVFPVELPSLMGCGDTSWIAGAVTALSGCVQGDRQYQKLPFFTLDRILDVKIPPRTSKVRRQALATAMEVLL